jgi:hypothetical protein
VTCVQAADVPQMPLIPTAISRTLQVRPAPLTDVIPGDAEPLRQDEEAGWWPIPSRRPGRALPGGERGRRRRRG